MFKDCRSIPVLTVAFSNRNWIQLTRKLRELHMCKAGRSALISFVSAISFWVYSSDRTTLPSQLSETGSKRRTVHGYGCILFFQVFVIFPSLTSAQSSLTSSVLTPFEKQALLAFNPGASSLVSLTMTGNATWIAGSLQESGTVMLKASADGSTAETWTLPTQSHIHTSTAWSAGRSCSSTNSKGVVSDSSDPNCLRSLPWFAPWVGFTLLSKGVVLGSHVTQAADKASGNEKLAFQTILGNTGSPADPSTAKLAQLESRAAVTLTFDQQTALSSVLDFNQIIDSDPAHTILYRIIFSDFRTESGYVVPHHIQRYIQRTLQADITITNVNVE